MTFKAGRRERMAAECLLACGVFIKGLLLTWASQDLNRGCCPMLLSSQNRVSKNTILQTGFSGCSLFFSGAHGLGSVESTNRNSAEESAGTSTGKPRSATRGLGRARLSLSFVCPYLLQMIWLVSIGCCESGFFGKLSIWEFDEIPLFLFLGRSDLRGAQFKLLSSLLFLKHPYLVTNLETQGPSLKLELVKLARLGPVSSPELPWSPHFLTD